MYKLHTVCGVCPRCALHVMCKASPGYTLQVIPAPDRPCTLNPTHRASLWTESSLQTGRTPLLYPLECCTLGLKKLPRNPKLITLGSETLHSHLRHNQVFYYIINIIRVVATSKDLFCCKHCQIIQRFFVTVSLLMGFPGPKGKGI